MRVLTSMAVALGAEIPSTGALKGNAVKHFATAVETVFLEAFLVLLSTMLSRRSRARLSRETLKTPGKNSIQRCLKGRDIEPCVALSGLPVAG